MSGGVSNSLFFIFKKSISAGTIRPLLLNKLVQIIKSCAVLKFVNNNQLLFWDKKLKSDRKFKKNMGKKMKE